MNYYLMNRKKKRNLNLAVSDVTNQVRFKLLVCLESAEAENS